MGGLIDIVASQVDVAISTTAKYCNYGGELFKERDNSCWCCASGASCCGATNGGT
jgi:hypothetical protein